MWLSAAPASAAPRKSCSISSRKQMWLHQLRSHWHSGSDCCHERKHCSKVAGPLVRHGAKLHKTFQSLVDGRKLVELFLAWKTSTGNLERRFRSVGEVDTPQRSSILDGTVETIMLASQAPPSAHLIALSRGDERQTSYLSQLQVWHERLSPVARETTVKRKQRRDAGVSRVSGPASAGPVAASAAPVTEAAFGRKREAAIANAVASSQAKRICVAPDMNWVQRADDPEMTPAPMCVEDVAKRVKQQEGKTTASVVAKRENMWCDQASKCH